MKKGSELLSSALQRILRDRLLAGLFQCCALIAAFNFLVLGISTFSQLCWLVYTTQTEVTRKHLDWAFKSHDRKCSLALPCVFELNVMMSKMKYCDGTFDSSSSNPF